MFEITRIIEWDMGHRIPFHKNKCSMLHGHRYRLELSLSGPLQQTKSASTEGMIFDFGDLKKIMKEKIHDCLDHKTLLYHEDSLLNLWPNDKLESFGIKLVKFIPTAENIVAWCYQELKNDFPDSIKIVSCRLYETPNAWVDYRPEA